MVGTKGLPTALSQTSCSDDSISFELIEMVRLFRKRCLRMFGSGGCRRLKASVRRDDKDLALLPKELSSGEMFWRNLSSRLKDDIAAVRLLLILTSRQRSPEPHRGVYIKGSRRLWRKALLQGRRRITSLVSPHLFLIVSSDSKIR
jgi:hypothetical protein